MISIARASEKDFQLVSDLAQSSFVESHGHSASPDVINNYINEKFSVVAMKAELKEPVNIYHVISYDSKPAGYSKIVLDTIHPLIAQKNITKLDRLYLLKEFYDLKLGRELLQFNINFSKESKDKGMWLNVWKENKRALDFYENSGFEVMGSYDFKLTESHANPNFLMFLRY